MSNEPKNTADKPVTLRTGLGCTGRRGNACEHNPPPSTARGKRRAAARAKGV